MVKKDLNDPVVARVTTPRDWAFPRSIGGRRHDAARRADIGGWEWVLLAVVTGVIALAILT
jgi:hypothetical protein